MRLLVIAFLVAAASIVGVGTWAWRRAGTRVDVIAPRRADIVQTLVTIGRVDPPAEITFAARESAAITRVPAVEGQHVVAGELLIQMDAAEAEASVLQAQAALEQAQARTRQVRTVSQPSAAATLRDARATLDDAKRQAERDEQLFAQGAMTAADLDASRTTYTLARNRLRTAELQTAAVSKRGADWQAAIAAEAYAEAGLLAAEARLERLHVVAPSPGTVIERAVEPGDVVQIGTRLGRMALDGPTRLVIEPDEKNLRLLALEQPALASAEAFPDDTFAAAVEFIAPAVDAMRGTIEVRLAVPEPPAYLRTDMTVSVEIEVGRAADALVLPADAVHELASAQPWVLVVERGIAVRRDVTLGLRGDTDVEVKQGVDEGDRIVATTIDDVDPGDRVRASE